jgi:hypothetical protein
MKQHSQSEMGVIRLIGYVHGYIGSLLTLESIPSLQVA